MQHFRQIREALGDNDAMLLTSVPNRFYASGFQNSSGAVIVTKDGANYVYTDSRYIEAAQNTIEDATVEEVTGGFKGYMAVIRDVIAKHNIKKLGFEESDTPYVAYGLIEKELGVELYPNQEPVTAKRAEKTPEEIEAMLEAEAISEKSYLETLEFITPEKTEKEIAAYLLYRMLSNGAEDKSFDPIVVSAEHSSMPHGVPSTMKIKKGFLTMDFGVKYKGYCSDTTRTICIGQPTEEMKKIYYTVYDAQMAGIEKAAVGVPCCDIDRAGRDVIEKAGYGKYFGHGFGHSLGIEIHEFPRASLSCDYLMRSGTVMTAEPGIYLPGKFGVRIEDVLYVTDEGCRDITKLDKNLIIL